MKRGARSRRNAHISTSTENRLLKPLIQIWLAGLGAVSKAQAEGPSLLNDLIKEGAGVQTQKRNAVEKAVRATLRDVQALVQRVVNELPPVRVLQEVRALRKQVNAMNAKIDNLARVPQAPRKRRIARRSRSAR